MLCKYQSGNETSDSDTPRKGSKGRKLMLTPPFDNGCKPLSRCPLTRCALEELERTTADVITPPPSVEDLDESKIDPEKLRVIASYGGPDLRDIKGYPNPLNEALADDMGRGQNGAETSTKSSTAYNADYESKLIDDLLPPWSLSYKRAELANFEELKAVMAGTGRMQAPFSDLDVPHQTEFIKKSHASTTEPKWVQDAFPYIVGTAEIVHEQEVVFNNFASVGKRSLAQAKPDYYEGSNPLEINQGVRDNLSKFIIPSTTKQRPILPNLCFETKGPRGLPTVARLQACHDGALGARAIHQLRSYGKDPEAMYDSNAYTVTATYSDGALAIYAHYPTSADGYRSLEAAVDITTAYHMYRIGSWLLDNDLDDYRKGITAFRNLRFWAKEKRDQFIAEANRIPKPYKAGDNSLDELQTSDVVQNAPFDTLGPDLDEGNMEGLLAEYVEGDDKGSEEEDDEDPEDQDDERKDKTFQPSLGEKGTNLQRNPDIPSAKRRYSDLDDEDFDDELGHTLPKGVGKRQRHG